MPDTATEIPMSDCGLSINVGEDGVWLCFTASDGKRAMVHSDCLVEKQRGGFFDKALSSWAADRQKQAEQIRVELAKQLATKE